MGVREFNAVARATAAQGDSDPSSWRGEERDPFWAANRGTG